VPNPTPGTILGAYRVEGTLGAGSMGDVFKGIDTGLNRRVAIKILSEKHRDSPELRQRFVREGRAVAAISHPNVVQVFATGSFDERPYIAMELLDGTDLGSIVEQQKAPLSSIEAAHAILDAAQGLAAASKAGLIHRDVKPSNLVRLADGTVKVTDFGLAKPMEPGNEPSLTAMGVVVGTPDYIAPEQARGEPIDERVDIYALGGTLYFILTGVPPFRTGRPADDKYLKVVARHLRNPAPDARERNPSVDAELAELAKRMMAKKSADRPTYQELVQLVTGVLARLDPGAVPEIIASTRERSRPNMMRLPSKDDRSGPAGLAPVIPLDASSDHTPTVSDGDIELPPRTVPVWLVLFTLACIGLFVAGLVVYLRKSGASPNPSGTGSGATAPIGMVLVTRGDGTKFYVDAVPVPYAAFRKVFADHQQPGSPDDPVVMVSYDAARSYATTRGGRLVRDDEWDIATVSAGVAVADKTYEWIDSPGDKKMVRARGGAQERANREQKDVTFRIARDL
jgi:serine/threonine protein kinase